MNFIIIKLFHNEHQRKMQKLSSFTDYCYATCTTNCQLNRCYDNTTILLMYYGVRNSLSKPVLRYCTIPVRKCKDKATFIRARLLFLFDSRFHCLDGHNVYRYIITGRFAQGGVASLAIRCELRIVMSQIFLTREIFVYVLSKCMFDLFL